MLTYTFKIKTTSSLIEKIENNFSVTRCIYNLAKETREYAYSKGVRLNKFDLMKQLPELKNDFTWIKDVHSQTLQGVIERLDKGYDKFFADLNKGIKTNKPKWAKKKYWKSVEFKSSALKVNVIKDIFEISKIGKIRIFKSREINGNIKLARIVKKADGYYLQIITDHEIQKCDNQAQIAIDLGISQFVVTSDGEYFENIRTTKKYEVKLAEAQRKLSLKKKFSNNFYKEVEKVKKIHLKIKRVREDYLHKVSRELANNYQYVVVEDLDVQKMLQNKDYSKSISDVSWSKFINYLEYKTNVIKVNPAYSSQECSKCGHISKENRKTQESFKCVKCNFAINADENASKVIKKRGQSLIGRV